MSDKSVAGDAFTAVETTDCTSLWRMRKYDAIAGLVLAHTIEGFVDSVEWHELHLWPYIVQRSKVDHLATAGV